MKEIDKTVPASPSDLIATRARDLQPGNLIDAVPIVEYLYEHDLCELDEFYRVLDQMSIVEGVEVERPADMGAHHDSMAFGSPDVAVVYTDQGSWAIPADMTVPRKANDTAGGD